MNLSVALVALVPAVGALVPPLVVVTKTSTMAGSALAGTIPAPLRTDEVEVGIVTLLGSAGLTAVIWVSEFTVKAAAVGLMVTTVPAG